MLPTQSQVSADNAEALCWFDITVINTGDLSASRNQQIPRRRLYAVALQAPNRPSSVTITSQPPPSAVTITLNLQRDEDDQKRFHRAAIKSFGAVAQLREDGFKATLAVLAISSKPLLLSHEASTSSSSQLQLLLPVMSRWFN
ncbi:hypothetical protein CH63R_03814 [Colletotrichum higginsianum IMI 349063]|uniref:Uncharacterized protein n=1 Tax=Colletotrichum higginsianum (strain IMI 349063) TaxID=759273 RepID=A0A1B7YI82_COLHI|nr:hypothetical protein CH63R_03814 [Colletotrichum higginsianum IMI 349063]OBR11518.1 hypothetical protein CH63R_03814 [Colletotrichum higginsianum IMI 349063]